jgi:hypothetical protein
MSPHQFHVDNRVHAKYLTHQNGTQKAWLNLGQSQQSGQKLASVDRFVPKQVQAIVQQNESTVSEQLDVDLFFFR